MLRNRYSPFLEHRLTDEEWKQLELRFDLYVKRSWYYIGGNHDYHIDVLTHMGYDLSDLRKIDDTTCYLCGRSLFRKRMIYIKQMKDYTRSVVQPIGHCCSSRYFNHPRTSSIIWEKQKVKID